MRNKLNSKYSIPDKFRLAWSLLLTKLFFRPARIIRQPTRIRGFNSMNIASGFTTGQYCRLEAMKPNGREYSLEIGRNVQINDSCHISAIDSIVISENVLIASNVYITDHDHGEFSVADIQIIPKERELISSPVFISKNVWLGEGVKILKGVKIGEGSVIGAGAVVTKDIPSYSLAIGIPAKVVKTLNIDKSSDL